MHTTSNSLRKKVEPRKLIAKEILGMPSDKIAQIYPFERKYKINPVSREGWKTNKIQLLTNGEGSRRAGARVYKWKGIQDIIILLGWNVTIMQL